MGNESLAAVNHNQQLLYQLADTLKTTPAELQNRAAQQVEEMRELRRLLEKQQAKQMMADTEQLLCSAKEIGGLRVLTASLNSADPDTLRKLGDFLRDRENGIVAVLASKGEDKLTFLAVCGKTAVEAGIRAGDLIRTVTKIAGGSGGGKPDIAMGGGKDITLLDSALAAVEPFVSANKKK